jgi:hypothetical protein
MFSPRAAKADKKGDGVKIQAIYGLMQSSKYEMRGTK